MIEMNRNGVDLGTMEKKEEFKPGHGNPMTEMDWNIIIDYMKLQNMVWLPDMALKGQHQYNRVGY